MEKMRSRKPTFKSEPSMAPKGMREDFKPAVEWSEDPSKRTLIILLPDFKREEIRVLLDNAGKLLINGSRKASDNKYIYVDQSFDVPKDTIAEKITGRFEDGCLTLIMPKKAVEEQEAIQKATSEERVRAALPEEKPKGGEGKKEEEAIQKETKAGEERKDEPIKEMSTSHEEKAEPMPKEEPQDTEEKQGQQAQKEKPKSDEDNKDQLTQKEKTKTEGEREDDGPVLKERMESVEDKKQDGPIHEQKIERGEEKKDEPVEKEKSESVEKKKKESVQTENTMSGAMEMAKEENTIQMMKSKRREICADKPKDIKKKISSWRGSEKSWFKSGSLDGILEKLSMNRKVIAVATVALLVGFYVSHKPRA